MDYSAKHVLFIDLQKKTSEVKSFPDLKKYIGGVGLGLKLLANEFDNNPLVFAVGPLNGCFPYASKTSLVLNHDGVVEDIYLGGSLSFRIKFMGIDAIVLNNSSNDPLLLDICDGDVSFRPMQTQLDTIGLPGRRSVINFDGKKAELDDFFVAPENILEKKLYEKGVHGIVFTGSKSFPIKRTQKYDQLFQILLEKQKDMLVLKDDFPSCSGCPMGCSRSHTGEIGGNVLVHSLVACTFAEKIYSDIGIVFSCLNTLGYDYTHEDIENLPELVENVIKEFS
ncbi:MAG TPA: aldehyde ferredoxin oxidoreductase N-terminal domain-containing protein [Candidatus Saccharimonadales bacterium]|nr:aldehyde ferredoxin oxidoreductase N-terminal domain-containing protein [Candidatus Saccharimonadales bacterium]